MATAAGAKDIKARDLNRYEMALFTIEARKAVPSRAARLLLELYKNGKTPGWVSGSIDFALMQAAAGV